KDPGQERDLSRDRPEVAARLGEAVARWKREVLAELPKKDDRPFPVGHRAFPVTTLPARDGMPHGNVRRSARAPNCSYFTNWIPPEARLPWAVGVAAAGRYEAVVYYPCPAADVGSTVALSFGGSALEGKVAEAHDPPPYGADHDRVPRAGESYMK